MTPSRKLTGISTPRELNSVWLRGLIEISTYRSPRSLRCCKPGPAGQLVSALQNRVSPRQRPVLVVSGDLVRMLSQCRWMVGRALVSLRRPCADILTPDLRRRAPRACAARRRPSCCRQRGCCRRSTIASNLLSAEHRAVISLSLAELAGFELQRHR
jgi:hypothetical protein